MGNTATSSCTGGTEEAESLGSPWQLLLVGGARWHLSLSRWEGIRGERCRMPASESFGVWLPGLQGAAGLARCLRWLGAGPDRSRRSTARAPQRHRGLWIKC